MARRVGGGGSTVIAGPTRTHNVQTRRGPPTGMDESRRIAGVDEVPEESTLLVTLRPVDPESVDESEGDVGEAEDGTPEA